MAKFVTPAPMHREGLSHPVGGWVRTPALNPAPSSRQAAAGLGFVVGTHMMMQSQPKQQWCAKLSKPTMSTPCTPGGQRLAQLTHVQALCLDLVLDILPIFPTDVSLSTVPGDTMFPCYGLVEPGSVVQGYPAQLSFDVFDMLPCLLYTSPSPRD